MHFSTRCAFMALVPALSPMPWSTVAGADLSSGLSVPPVVVTASRFQEAGDSLPVGVEVITRGQIEASGVVTLPEVLGQQMSIVVRDNSGGPNRQIDLRGFGAFGDQNTLVLVNGQRISENEQTPADLASIALANVERIEIMRGSGAVLYGTGATGGTINVITRSPDPGDRDVRLAATGGSYGTWGLSASGSAGSERVAVGFNVAHLASDNYRRNNDLVQDNLQAQLRWFTVRGPISLVVARSRQDLRLPGERTASQLVSDRRGTSKPDDASSLEATRTVLSTTQAFEWGDAAVDAMYRDRHSQSFQFGGFNTIDSRVLGISPRIRVPFSTGSVAHELIAGLDWENWAFDNRIDGLSYSGTAEQENGAVYFQDALRTATGTTVTVGARHQRARSGLDEGGTVSSRLRHVGVYELAVRHAIVADWSAHAKMGRSFRLANVDEVRSFGFGPPNLLEPQKSIDREIGAQYAARGRTLRLTYFWSRLTNEILFDPVAFSNVNLPPTERRGVEFEAGARLTDRWQVRGTYTWLRATFREGTFGGSTVGGNDIPLVPRNKASVTVSLQADAATRVATTATYVGRQRFDNDQTNTYPIRMPAYTVVDVSVIHDHGPWRVRGSITNLLGAQYYSYALANVPAIGTFSAYPAAGRALLVTAEYGIDARR